MDYVVDRQHSDLTADIIVNHEKVKILYHDKGSVHLLGTHHNRRNSALAVDELISMVRPHVVAVELCRTNLERYNRLNEQPSPADDRLTSKNTHMDFVPVRLRDRAVGEELLLGLVLESMKYDRYCLYRRRAQRFALKNPHMRRFLLRPKLFHNVIIGREMTAPFGNFVWSLERPDSRYLLSPGTDYKIMLADKPVEDTFCSIASALSDEERSIVQVYRSNFLKLFVSSSSASKTIMMNMISKNRKLYNAIVRERDEYMAKSLQKALDDADTLPREKARVVAIMGKQHVAGIVRHWCGVICKSRKVRFSTKMNR